MKNIIIALISLGSAGFGAVLAYFLSRKLILQTHLNALKLIEINHANAIQLLQKTGLNKASADFRSAFVTAIRLWKIPPKKLMPIFPGTYSSKTLIGTTKPIFCFAITSATKGVPNWMRHGTYTTISGATIFLVAAWKNKKKIERYFSKESKISLRLLLKNRSICHLRTSQSSGSPINIGSR